MIKRFARKVGIDKAIAYSSGSNILAAVASLLTIYFISSYLLSDEQGYYYTFGSILAIQTFFDLGLTGIMTQYVAHEQVHLKWDENGISLIGEEKYKSRLSSLLHFCVKWYGIISILMLFALIFIGIIFFNRYGMNKNIDWLMPWILVCLGTALNLFVAPIISFLNGLGKVKEVAKIFFYKQMIIPAVTWIGLIIGASLYVLGVASICTAIYVALFIVLTDFYPILKGIWYNHIDEKVLYMKEIFPYQWKIALSWISGFFIFQLFNPVLFATEGAVVAGQMGMTLQVLNGINGLSMSWISTKVPLFSRLIEVKDYIGLDKVFNKTLKQETSVCMLLLFIFLIGVYLIRIIGVNFKGNELGDRFLPYIPLILMIIPLFANQFTFSFATYLRCHKQEPFMVQSIVMGILTMMSTLILGKYYGLYGICIGYCLLTTLLGTPWGYLIFKNKKNEWH